MEQVGEVNRRLEVLEQRHADLRRIVHLIATNYAHPPHPDQVALPNFKPAVLQCFCVCQAQLSMLRDFAGSVLRL